MVVRFLWRPVAARCRAAALAAVLATAPAAPGLAQAAVDLELVLAIDCSYSVDGREFAIQVLGLAEAFRSPAVIEAIAAGGTGAIAVSVLQWSRRGAAEVALPWQRIDGAAAAHALAGQLAAMPRLGPPGSTSISDAIEVGARLLAASPFTAPRQVIDITADGRNNNGKPPAVMRDLALLQGITINGLAILDEVPTLHFYFAREVIGGPGAFVMQAADYQDYRRAIERKLWDEISNQPLSAAPHEGASRMALAPRR